MAESENTRRVCLLADIDGYGEQQPVAQSGLTLRLKGVISAALKSAGFDNSETWRQDRVSRQLALLPVAADAATAVPMLIRGLVAELGKDRVAADGPPLRVRAAIARDAVSQVKGSYAGRAVVTAIRLLDSPAVRAELSGDPAALLALIVSDGAYHDVLARGSGEFRLDGFRRVSVDMREQGWQGAGWIRSYEPGSVKPPPKRIGKAIRDNLLPMLAGGTDDLVSSLDAMTGMTGGTGDSELTAAAEHESYAVSDQAAAETAYVVDVTHSVAYDNSGYIQEYETHSVYDGTAYDAQGYDSSADYHDGVV
jgi:hypothetical protein